MPAGLRDGVPVGEQDVASLTSVISVGLGATKDIVAEVIASRPQRATAYAT